MLDVVLAIPSICLLKASSEISSFKASNESKSFAVDASISSNCASASSRFSFWNSPIRWYISRKWVVPSSTKSSWPLVALVIRSWIISSEYPRVLSISSVAPDALSKFWAVSISVPLLFSQSSGTWLPVSSLCPQLAFANSSWTFFLAVSSSRCWRIFFCISDCISWELPINWREPSACKMKKRSHSLL